MKQYIIAKAFTGSEWDSVDFGLIELTPELVERTRRLQKVVDELYQKDGVNAIIVYSDSVDFYIDFSKLPEGTMRDENIDEEFTPFIIDLDKNTINTLSQPKQTIEYGEIVFSRWDVTFEGTGKNTDEPFWVSIPYEVILKSN